MRMERDELGEVAVPLDALYGAQTQRAIENFPISGRLLGREFIRALGLIKKAAALTNAELDVLEPNLAERIANASDEVIAGLHDSQFVIDVFQTGSGTSTNMNANEVIARLAHLASGLAIHPNDHVNRSQSSNDAIPTAIHIAAAESIEHKLLPAMSTLETALRAKATEFSHVLKIGRTHLQDAVPMYLGDEMGAYARQVELAARRIETVRDGLWELALGGTAIGTGLNAPKDFSRHAIALLAEWTGLPFREAENHFEAQSARDAVAAVSGALKGYAIALIKIGNDIRLLASGPQCGLGELRLQAVQPGSSIMPGKTNPVIIESMLMACAEVMGHDAAIGWCCASGQLELNAMLPLMAYDLLDAISLLGASSRNFATRCVSGLSVNHKRTEAFVEESLALATALTKEIGHDKAAAIAQAAAASGRTVREVAHAQSGLSDEKLDELLDPARLANGNRTTITRVFDS